MRALVLSAVLLAVPASAQPTDSPVGSTRHVRLLVGGAVTAGIPLLLLTVSDGVATAGLAAAPLVAAVAVHYVGTDGRGSFSRTLSGALIGALPGAVVLGVAGARACSGDDGCFGLPVPSRAGSVLYVVGSAVGAALLYQGSTSTVAFERVPGGEVVPVIAFRVAL